MPKSAGGPGFRGNPPKNPGGPTNFLLWRFDADWWRGVVFCVGSVVLSALKERQARIKKGAFVGFFCYFSLSRRTILHLFGEVLRYGLSDLAVPLWQSSRGRPWLYIYKIVGVGPHDVRPKFRRLMLPGYGLTDAVNGKLWPPLNITLPVTMVPGTPAAPTVAVQTAWAPTGMMP